MITVSLYGQTDWPVYGHDSGGMRYSPLRQITVSNVAKLERAWTYHTGEIYNAAGTARGQRTTAFETTPLVIGNTLYFSTPSNRVIALEANSGKQLWSYDPHCKPHPHRGVAYWPGDREHSARIVYGTEDGRLIALNAKNGTPVPGFGNEGIIDLRKGVGDRFPNATYSVTSPPAIFDNLVITGAEVPERPGQGPSGDVRAFDLRDGRLAWTFHTSLARNDHDRTGINVWSIMTVDREHGLIFLPIGAPAYDFYGGDRPGENLYANSLVALNVRTGERVWHFQFTHHDIWDYDPPAAPLLLNVKGKPAVAQVTKMGLVFLFDRLTGAPLFPIKEQPVPGSDVPGEQTWPTQPIPVKPPPISRAFVEASEIGHISPEHDRFCLELFSKLKTKGRYTPFGRELTLVFPGTLGGATWSGASFDPQQKLLFVNANEIGAIGQMAEEPAGSPARYRRTSMFGDYGRFWDSNLWPCQQPPWGTLTAIAVETGDLHWRVPLGVTAAGNTGAPNLGGSISTAGGVVFIAATNDSLFRAFDASKGKELWAAKLESSGHATPITYLGKDGKQYVVIAAGGGGFFGSPPADALIAFRLP
jgi:quinoprotein glucose dehydrogenase